jgi:hypothetical protein
LPGVGRVNGSCTSALFRSLTIASASANALPEVSLASSPNRWPKSVEATISSVTRIIS